MNVVQDDARRGPHAHLILSLSQFYKEGITEGRRSILKYYVLSVLKFTYPTLFQGWQTLIGGLLLHVSWKLRWVEINSSSRSDVLTWLPASVLFVGIIYAGSRALSRLAIPVFLTLHNVAEVIICGHQKCFRKEKTSPAKICSALFLLAAAGSLPFNDSQFDPDGYFWAVIHLFCVGDLLSVLDFPFLYFYRFHGSCCASGFLGFFLMFSTVKLKSLMAPGQCAAWIFFAKPPARRTWRSLAGFLGAEEGLLNAGKVDSQAAAGEPRPGLQSSLSRR
ncbi:transmembrane protein 241 isoform X6 [Hippopotamus amphibius kiboko]|uniref:transmembrane protein 241 isoform X6 n=1 Tax=Hippopotamus amphibius kiboko TaxID=575201 RepID=UPI0025913FED|nr:transmembrane protein 241 isoform X6 [Hippopotamus amphibius kiboko]